MTRPGSCLNARSLDTETVDVVGIGPLTDPVDELI